MKKLILLLITTMVVGCVDTDKFDDLKAEINTAIPIGTYGITAEDFVDMLGLDVSKISPDKVIEISYTDDEYSVVDENMIADLVKIDDQRNPASFNLTRLTGALAPGESRDVVIDDAVSDVFTSNTKLTFKDKGRPTKVVFERATISVEVVTDMPDEDMFIEFEGITKDGVPLVVGFGESVVIDGSYSADIVEVDGGDPSISVSVKGRTTVKSNSVLSMSVNLSDAVVAYIEGDLERQVENGVSAFDLSEISKGMENIGDFYPADISFNINVNNAFESLPMLVQLTKIIFTNKSDVSKNIDIDIKEGLGFDRFFLNKGANTISINNSITTSGKGFSESFSKDLGEVKVEYTIIINPTDADAKGEVLQDRNNKLLVNTEINSSAYFNVPLKGYVKGIAIDTVMAVEFDIEALDVKALQYNISAVNSFPLDLDIELVVMEKETNKIISKEEAPIKINGKKSLTYDVSNVRTISGESLNKLFNKQANLGMRLRGNTVGADNKEIVSFMGSDKIDISLFLGVNGIFSLNGNNEQ